MGFAVNCRQWAPFCLALLGAMLVPIAPAQAQNLAYVRASSQRNFEEKPPQFHPLNLLDGDPATTWCEGARGLGRNEEVQFYFNKPQKIDRIVVVPSTESGRVVEAVRISDGTNSVRINVGKTYVERTFRPAMRGTTYTVTIEKTGVPNQRSDLPKDVSCIADIGMYFRKKPYGGRLQATDLRYNSAKDKILGRWAGSPLGAPETFITFGLDGTWRWNFKPLRGGKSKKLKGEYRFRGNRLLMRKGETGRWADVRFKHRVVRVDPLEFTGIAGDYQVITLNKVLGPKVGGEYNNAQF